MGETIFLGYDRAALDREHDNRGKVANDAEYLARYPAESARTRDALPARFDLRYGPAPGETLDLFLRSSRSSQTRGRRSAARSSVRWASGERAGGALTR